MAIIMKSTCYERNACKLRWQLGGDVTASELEFDAIVGIENQSITETQSK